MEKNDTKSWQDEYEETVEQIDALFKNEALLNRASARLSNTGEEFDPSAYRKGVTDFAQMWGDSFAPDKDTPPHA